MLRERFSDDKAGLSIHKLQQSRGSAALPA